MTNNIRQLAEELYVKAGRSVTEIDCSYEQSLADRLSHTLSHFLESGSAEDRREYYMAAAAMDAYIAIRHCINGNMDRAEKALVEGEDNLVEAEKQ